MVAQYGWESLLKWCIRSGLCDAQAKWTCRNVMRAAQMVRTGRGKRFAHWCRGCHAASLVPVAAPNVVILPRLQGHLLGCGQATMSFEASTTSLHPVCVV